MFTLYNESWNRVNIGLKRKFRKSILLFILSFYLFVMMFCVKNLKPFRFFAIFLKISIYALINFFTNYVYFWMKKTFLHVFFLPFLFFFFQSCHFLSGSFFSILQDIFLSIFLTDEPTDRIDDRFIFIILIFILAIFPQWTFLMGLISAGLFFKANTFRMRITV